MIRRPPKKIVEPSAPDELRHTLTWFARIIERPIDQESRMMPLSPEGISMEEEAARFISASPTMLPHERIEVYNQQYWWRLLGILHENYPLLVRLFGYTAFNHIIAAPYLCAYRPDHWSLGHLGGTLFKHLDETYQTEDRRLILDAAVIDYAHILSFFNQQLPIVSLSEVKVQKDLTELIEVRLYLQPHLQLFELPYHLLDFRNEMLDHPGDHYLDNPLPVLKKGQCYFAIFRNSQNRVSWQELTKGQFHLLQLFKNGHSAAAACDWLERQKGTFFEEALTNVHLWFQEWIINGWFTHQPHSHR